jgi:23S rRNA (pseudouridine1915-N3)-methyltransferase
MKILLVGVGRVRGSLAEPMAEYEKRIGRYFSFESCEVREEPARRGTSLQRVRVEEGNRLLARVPRGLERVALHREGLSWSSDRLAGYLSELGLSGTPGVAFLIGGAYGLSDEVLDNTDHRLSLSHFTLPHDLARLVFTEQLYRAGAILRGEPYHKTRSSEA